MDAMFRAKGGMGCRQALLGGYAYEVRRTTPHLESVRLMSRVPYHVVSRIFDSRGYLELLHCDVRRKASPHTARPRSVLQLSVASPDRKSIILEVGKEQYGLAHIPAMGRRRPMS